MMRYHGFRSGGTPVAHQIVSDLLRLLVVVPLENQDYKEVLSLYQYDYEIALLFVTCRKVGARFLVTRDDFGRKRTPVHRRTAAEVLAVFK